MTNLDLPLPWLVYGSDSATGSVGMLAAFLSEQDAAEWAATMAGPSQHDEPSD